MEHFKGHTTVAAVKVRFQELAVEHHPDLGGDPGVMAEISRQYHAALERLDGEVSTDSKGDPHVYRYREKTEDRIKEKALELIGAGLPGCTVTIIGTWIWITGDTRPSKDHLKAAKCRFHGKRKCWYWRPYGGRKRRYSGKSLKDLAEKYGAEEVTAAGA